MTVFESRADLLAREQDQTVSDQARWTARSTAGAIAIGGVVTALTLNAFALQRYLSSADASQQYIAGSNQTIRRLNIASLVCYAIAGAAGGTWGWLGRQSDLADLVVAVDRPAGGAGSGFALSFGASF